jgi:hypothetical protein
MSTRNPAGSAGILKYIAKMITDSSQTSTIATAIRRTTYQPI